MTDSERVTRSASNGSIVRIKPALAEGWSRLLLFVGMGGFALGTFLDSGLAAWGGFAVITLAFVLNTAGKVTHYLSLPIPAWETAALAGTWLLLVGTVLALLGTFTYARYGPGSPRFFWSLAVAAVGFALLHMGAQSSYLETDHRDATE